MKIVCFQCKKEIGEKAPFPDKRETHALCYRCLKQLLERRFADKERLREGQLWKFDPEVTSTSEIE
jgi:hypothetical protein